MERAIGQSLYRAVNPGVVWDVQTRRARTQEGGWIELDDAAIRLLYLVSLATPISHAARSLDCEVEALTPILERLSHAGLITSHDVAEEAAIAAARGITGAPKVPWRERTITHLLREGLSASPSAVLLHVADDGTAVTRREASLLIHQVAARLRAKGLRPRDRLCFDADPSLEAALLFWAATTLGVIAVPLSNTLGRQQIARIFEVVEPKALICKPDGGKIASLATSRPISLLDVRSVVRPQSSMRSGGRLEIPVASPDDIAVIQFTSGTTGEPRGAPLSHCAYYRATQNTAELSELGPHDVSLTPIDLSSGMGVRTLCTLPLYGGGSAVVPDKESRRVPLGLVRLCSTYRVTDLEVVPRALRHILQCADRLHRDDLASLRVVRCVTAPLNRTILAGFAQISSARILDMMGSTEAPGCIIYADATAGGTISEQGGAPIGVLAQVVDESGKPCAPGQVGELRVYSDRNMRGYWNAPQATAAVLRKDWLYTGDLATSNEVGRIRIVGRTNEMIKSRYGDKLYPVEVEQVLHDHDHVSEVVVCGRLNSDGSEQLIAFVIPASKTVRTRVLVHELKELAQRELGPGRVPDEVHICREFPRSQHGKVKKATLIADSENFTIQT